MVKWKCIACKAEVCTFHGYQPRACKKCRSGSAWMVAIDSTSGILPKPMDESNMAVSERRWKPEDR
jgi:hypothetical protein